MVTRWLGLLNLLFLAFAPRVSADSLFTRDLNCDNRFAARELAICKALERELEWVWTGHAIISPSYRITFESARRVLCSLPISAADTRSIVVIAVSVERQLTGKFADAQLANGSRFILKLLGQHALDGFPARETGWDERAWQIANNLREEIAQDIADPAMIWHPKNPQYMLRDRCK